MITDELLARWVNFDSETVRQDNERVQWNKHWQHSNNVSKSSAQEECDTYNSLFLLKHYLAHGTGAAPGCSTNDLQQSALIPRPKRNQSEMVSDSETSVEGGASTFKTHNFSKEIALQLDDVCLQYVRSGTSEVVRNSAVGIGDTYEVKNELKDGYERNEVKNELKDGYK